MIMQPKVGVTARVHYNKRDAPNRPYHGKIGEIVIVSRGKGPKNVGLEIDGKIVCVPRGNLMLLEKPIP